ncbi:TPM domain-containing protein [Serinicoccus profundi]|uniref:TPM domain-containing protein n=1 Tax=Serinicoccus profundi TaxID=1078471 RepID=UPI00030F1DE8|nr:TPM domain-containing protein [Serinicoccus profundi]
MSAQEPFDLPDELVDQAEVLTGTEELTSAQDRFTERTGLQLFVVVVDDFAGQEGADWLAQTAELSGLGEQDLAVAVSVDDADASALVPPAAGLDPDAVSAIVEELTAQARAQDAPGAVRTAVVEITALDPVDTAQQTRTAAAWAVGLLLALAVVLVAITAWRHRRRASARAAEARRRAQELSRLLGGDVVSLDQDLADTRILIELAEAEVERSQTAPARAELSDAEDLVLEVHRARAGLSTGATDDLTWTLPADVVVKELQRLRSLVSSARDHLADARSALPR